MIVGMLGAGLGLAMVLFGAIGTGCYQPSPIEGLPCSPTGECPNGQTCDPTTMVCGGVAPGLDASLLADGGRNSRDAGVAPDGMLGAFDDPTAVDVINADGYMDEDPTLTGDGLRLVFMTTRSGDADLFESARGALGESWTAPRGLVELNTDGYEGCPDISRDGRTLYFMRETTVHMSVRKDVDDPWKPPQPVTDLDAGSEVDCISISGDGDSAVLAAYAAGGQIVLYRAVRQAGGWSTPIELTSLPGYTQRGPWLDDDGLELWFHGKEAGSGTDSDIYRAKRSSIDEDFDGAELISELSTDDREADPSLTSDKRYLILSRGEGSDGDFYEATR